MLKKILLFIFVFNLGFCESYDILPIKFPQKGKDPAFVTVLNDDGIIGGRCGLKPFIYTRENGIQLLEAPYGEVSFIRKQWVIGIYSEDFIADKGACGTFIYDMQTQEMIDLLSLQELKNQGIIYAYPIGIDKDGVVTLIINDDNELIMYYDIPRGIIHFKSSGLPSDYFVLAQNEKQCAGIYLNKIFMKTDDKIEYSDPLPKDSYVEYLCFNNLGHVIGSMEDSLMSFYWNPSKGKKLQWIKNGLMQMNDHDVAVGINDSGAIIWSTNTGTRELKKLIPTTSKWKKLLAADHINNKGWITGLGLLEGEMHCFLLIPKSND